MQVQTSRRDELADPGPPLRYTNQRAHEMTASVDGFARLVNNDLHDLLTWAARLKVALAKADAEVTALASALRAAGVPARSVQKIIDEARSE